MGKAAVAIDFSFPDLLGAVEGSRDRIQRTIASSVQTLTGLRFDAEGAYHGHEHWKPLKYRQGQILSLTGTLRKSISPPTADGNPGPQGWIAMTGTLNDLLTVVGTKILYASVHDRGAKIKWPGTANGFGQGIKLGPHEIPIPARPFTDLNKNDLDEIEETLANTIVDILEHATA